MSIVAIASPAPFTAIHHKSKKLTFKYRITKNVRDKKLSRILLILECHEKFFHEILHCSSQLCMLALLLQSYFRKMLLRDVSRKFLVIRYHTSLKFSNVGYSNH